MSEKNDIAQRLMGWSPHDDPYPRCLLDEAAHRIDLLTDALVGTKALLVSKTDELATAIKERDDAQRRYCLAWVELTRLYEKLSVKEAARKFANNLGFDCFKEGGGA